MKYATLIFILVFVILPSYTFAVCSNTGSTVVFVNGILNSQEQADKSKYDLERAFQKKFGDINIKFITGYNPSHIAGIGDLAQSAAQMLDGSVSDFDLTTILMQIQPEVTTQRILLVGHSQGTLYTNSIYDYLVAHGVPAESIAVYNVATPAHEVAGNGGYLTSSNDSLIGALAALAEKLRAPLPLPPNIYIPIFPDDTKSTYPGHNFIRAYLAGASDQIVRDISRTLDGLAASPSSDTETCFSAPAATLGYKLEGAVLWVLDPTATAVVAAARNVVKAELALAEAVGSAALAAAKGIGNAAAAIFAFGQNEPDLAAKPPSEPPDSSKPGFEDPQKPGFFPPGDVLPGAVGERGGFSRGEGPESTPTEIVALELRSASAPLSLKPGFESPQKPGFSPSGAGDEVLAASNVELPLFLQLHPVGGGVAGFGGGSSPSPGSGQAPNSNNQIPNNDQNSNDQNEEEPEEEAPPDITPPDVSFSIKECDDDSISPEGCLLLGTSLNLRWSSMAGDLDKFSVMCEVGGETCDGLNFASTTATSTAYVLPLENSTYTFKAKAIDTAGNESDFAVATVEHSSMPVVINEVAWAGTKANANDEWIELVNRTAKSVDLAGWVLHAEDGVPYLNLSGTIAGGGYYLIERSEDDTVNGVAADFTAPFSGAGAGSGLGNSGEALILARVSSANSGQATTTIDQTVLCSNQWCGGATGGDRPSMERINMDAPGTDQNNWGTANGLVKNGLDVGGGELAATPKARNSLHYLVSQSATLGADRILKKSFGTYIIQNNFNLTVPSGKTLTVEPGVTVRIGAESKLTIDGTLKAEGTEAENIIFTSLNPAQFWKTIYLTSNALTSNLNYVKFEYGGRYFNNTPLEERAELAVKGNSTPVSNSVFKNSFSAGARFTASDSSITSNTFSVGTTSPQNIGVYVSGGAPAISQNTFSENYTGLYLEGAISPAGLPAGQAGVSNNAFTDNVDYPIYSTNSTVAYSGNSGSGNGKDAIALFGSIAASGATTTLSANLLPYLAGPAPYNDTEIPAGAGVILKSGVKFTGLDNASQIVVDGALKLEGSGAGDIVFTSFSDTGPAEWSGILVNSGGYFYGGGFALRYGGKGAGCPTCAGIRVLGGKADLADGIVENNYLAGARFEGSATSTLSRIEFRNHQAPAGVSTALISENSSLILTDLTFDNNFIKTLPPGLY